MRWIILLKSGVVIMRNKKDLRKTNGFVTYIRQFGNVTTLHGVNHMVDRERHSLEIILWFSVTVLAALGAITIVTDNWQRYDSNPTVINLEKNYRTWKLELPAATLCPDNHVDENKAAEYIESVWGVDEEDTKFDYYMKFVDSVSNLNYDNMDDFKEYTKDPSLAKIDMADLALKVLHQNITYTSMVFQLKYKYLRLKETVTEMGICYTYSGVISNYLSLRRVVPYDVSTEYIPPYCNFLDALCYGRIEDLEGDFKYYMHSPYGFPDISKTFYIISGGSERDISIKGSTTVAADTLRRLTPRQRRCRFIDEPMDHMDSSVYNYDLCKMHCRRSYAIQKCNCFPYFYGKSHRDQVCDVKGLACLAKFAEEIKSFKSCSCPQLCQYTNFFPIREFFRKWIFDSEQMSANIRWGVEVFSKTRYKRDVMFTFEDLIVSFGGSVGFFLGCSVITLVELFYFFTLRLFWFLVTSFKNRHRPSLTASLG